MGCAARNDGQDLPFGADCVDSVRSSASMASGVRSGRLISASYALQSAASLTVGEPCCPGWWSTVRVELSDVGDGDGDRLLLDIGVTGQRVHGTATIYRFSRGGRSQ